jgi:flavin reductase (DIM6/NTAB) family NADH-FMN oxidoreductase RutF
MPEEFDRQMREVLRLSARPMVIVTVAAGDESDGCLVGYHSPISIDPRRYMVCLSTANRTYEIAQRATTLVVHHIEVFQKGIARLFGEETGFEIDKFDRVEWHRGPDGVPVLSDIATWWAGRIVEKISLGDHTGFVLEPFIAEVGDDLDPFHTGHAADFEAGETRRNRQPS